MVDVGHEPPPKVYGILMDECSKRRLLDRAYDLLSRLISSGVTPVVDTFVPLIDGHLSVVRLRPPPSGVLLGAVPCPL